MPILRDNYAWVVHDGRDAVVVDPGQADPILSWLHHHGLHLKAILVTHHHGDHVGGIAGLLAQSPCPVYGPAAEPIPLRTHALADGDRVRLAAPALELAVLAVPGHTLGHLAYFGHGYLFCGDTLFSCGCGRLFEGTAAQMHASLTRLAALPEDTLVCCAHEYTLANIAFAQTVDADNLRLHAWAELARRLRRQQRPTLPTRMAQERATNPFLRCDRPELRVAVSRMAGHEARTPVEVFALLRALKDEFHA